MKTQSVWLRVWKFITGRNEVERQYQELGCDPSRSDDNREATS